MRFFRHLSKVVFHFVTLGCIAQAVFAQTPEKLKLESHLMGVTRPARSTLKITGSQPFLRAVEALIVGGKAADKILDGRPATSGQFPWQVALVMAGQSDNRNAQFCGGSLIGPTKVITAAHCVDGGTTASQINVVIGSLLLSDAGAKRIPVVRIDVHPSWRPYTHDGDVAVLTLAEPPPLSTSAAVALSSLPIDAAGTMLTVSGWGVTEFDNNGSDELRWVNVQVVGQAVCNESSKYNGRITDGMLCAGSLLGGGDSCSGDSGGPLAQDQQVPTLVGIVSWGQGCGLPNKPGVYTRVSKYAGWIKNQMK